MRVLVAPDKFAGTLTALAAAEAIAAGWHDAAPDDALDVVPMADGGPGFVDVLRMSLSGTTLETSVAGPLGEPARAAILRSGADAFLETAQSCGLHLVPADRRDPMITTTYGVGQLLATAIEDGARGLMLGLGGSATNDGGAGMLAALGASPRDGLRRGGAALHQLSDVDLRTARERVAGCEIAIASDVDNPLLGDYGASAVFGPQKGAGRAEVAALESALARFAELAGRPEADMAGAGAAGGLGYGLFLLGARRVSGIDAVLDAVGLAERVSRADLVITGEGSFDSQSLRGKVVSGVARAARARGVACLVLAGQVVVDQPEAAAAGVEAAYAMAEHVGSTEAALARPAEVLRSLAARTARGWTNRG
ncbi:MAG: glycerate kinase [Streptosporangiaceae bacterium]